MTKTETAAATATLGVLDNDEPPRMGPPCDTSHTVASLDVIIALNEGNGRKTTTIWQR
jgi:hypothetical protein